MSSCVQGHQCGLSRLLIDCTQRDLGGPVTPRAPRPPEPRWEPFWGKALPCKEAVWRCKQSQARCLAGEGAAVLARD